MRDEHSVLIAGYAKLPASITAETVYSQLAVAVIFDDRSGVITAADVSMVTEVARSFVADLFIGYNLNDGMDGLIALLEKHYHGAAKKALETAAQSMFARYSAYLEGKG